MKIKRKLICLNCRQEGRGPKKGRGLGGIHRFLNTFSTEFVDKGSRALKRLGFFSTDKFQPFQVGARRGRKAPDPQGVFQQPQESIFRILRGANVPLGYAIKRLAQGLFSVQVKTPSPGDCRQQKIAEGRLQCSLILDLLGQSG